MPALAGKLPERRRPSLGVVKVVFCTSFPSNKDDDIIGVLSLSSSPREDRKDTGANY